MERNDPTPQFNGDDEQFLRNALEEIVTSSESLQRDVTFMEQQEADARQLALNEVQVCDYLRGTLPSVAKLEQIIDSLCEEKEIPLTHDVMILLGEMIDELTNQDAPEELIASARHMNEVAYVVGSIALELQGEHTGDAHNIHAAILDSEVLSAEEKTAFIDAANHFSVGAYLEPGDVEAAANAVLARQREQDEADASSALHRKANILFDQHIARRYGLDVDTEDKSILRIMVGLAASIGSPVAMGNVDEVLARQSIPKEEFYEIVNSIIAQVRGSE